MQDYIQGKMNEIDNILHEILAYHDRLDLTEPPIVMLTTLDIEGVDVNDIMVDVYNKDDEQQSLANVCLYDLLESRLDLYGINRQLGVKLDDEDDMHEFKMHLLNLMLLRAYDIWKMKYKDMPYDQIKDSAPSKDEYFKMNYKC